MKSLLPLFLLLSQSAPAEYRAFRLQISNADGSESREEISTLDPDQYRGYHTAKQGERIVYTATWMCRGRTSDLPICPNPRELASTETPEAPTQQQPLTPAPAAAPAAPSESPAIQTP
ncbi:MAG: hypothetical protein ACAH59_13245 [Pseudobdellovibrionaceae bacterium]